MIKDIEWALWTIKLSPNSSLYCFFLSSFFPVLPPLNSWFLLSSSQSSLAWHRHIVGSWHLDSLMELDHLSIKMIVVNHAGIARIPLNVFFSHPSLFYRFNLFNDSDQLLGFSQFTHVQVSSTEVEPRVDLRSNQRRRGGSSPSFSFSTLTFSPLPSPPSLNAPL